MLTSVSTLYAGILFLQPEASAPVLLLAFIFIVLTNVYFFSYFGLIFLTTFQTKAKILIWLKFFLHKVSFARGSFTTMTQTQGVSSEFKAKIGPSSKGSQKLSNIRSSLEMSGKSPEMKKSQKSQKSIPGEGPFFPVSGSKTINVAFSCTTTRKPK